MDFNLLTACPSQKILVFQLKKRFVASHAADILSSIGQQHNTQHIIYGFGNVAFFSATWDPEQDAEKMSQFFLQVNPDIITEMN